MSTWVVASLVVLLAPCAAQPAGAYGWPVKPFNKPHAIRGAFDDPRFHLGAEGALSAFHFGVDIAARDGTPVYAVAPGFVRRRPADVTVRRKSGRAFGYWHIRPVVRSGRHVHLHQLLGYVLPGWGHVHFAESLDGAYRNPLRPRALTPFRDHTHPTVASVWLRSPDGPTLSTAHVAGSIDIEADIYDTPPIPPGRPWQVARLTPALIWWKILRGGHGVTDWNLAVDFHFALMPESLYNWVYAPGTYQNKPNRPGRYLFWLAHGFDTTSFADGPYQLEVLAEDTRGNTGSTALDFTIANGSPPVAPSLAAGMASPFRRPV